MLLNRYDELTTQYDADLKRLNFIVDGEANLNASFSTHCPFCDGEVVVKKNQNYIDAAKSDYKKIKSPKALVNINTDRWTENQKELCGIINEIKELDEDFKAFITSSKEPFFFEEFLPVTIKAFLPI